MKSLRDIVTNLWGHEDSGREIRIPGGKSKNGNHASFGIAERKGLWGWEIAVVPYDPKIDKFLLSDEEEYLEDMKGTLQREYIEETGIEAIQYFLLGEKQVQDNRHGREDLIHSKYLFMITDYDASNIRQIPSRSKRIYPPIWVPVEILETNLWENHRWMYSLYKEYKENPEGYHPRIISSTELKSEPVV